MARILRKSIKGEPPVTKTRNSWGRPGRNGLRGKLSMTTLRKAKPEDAVMAGVETMTVSSDGLIKVTAGTVVPGTKPGRRMLRKAQKLTPNPAKGTRVVSPPSPTNRGGVKSPYKKNV